MPCQRRYIYHSLYSFFGRANVGLPNFARYFKRSSDEEREHAELLMEQQARAAHPAPAEAARLPSHAVACQAGGRLQHWHHVYKEAWLCAECCHVSAGSVLRCATCRVRQQPCWDPFRV